MHDFDAMAGQNRKETAQCLRQMGFTWRVSWQHLCRLLWHLSGCGYNWIVIAVLQFAAYSLLFGCETAVNQNWNEIWLSSLSMHLKAASKTAASSKCNKCPIDLGCVAQALAEVKWTAAATMTITGHICYGRNIAGLGRCCKVSLVWLKNIRSF